MTAMSKRNAKGFLGIWSVVLVASVALVALGSVLGQVQFALADNGEQPEAVAESAAVEPLDLADYVTSAKLHYTVDSGTGTLLGSSTSEVELKFTIAAGDLKDKDTVTNDQGKSVIQLWYELPDALADIDAQDWKTLKQNGVELGRFRVVAAEYDEAGNQVSPAHFELELYETAITRNTTDSGQPITGTLMASVQNSNIKTDTSGKAVFQFTDGDSVDITIRNNDVSIQKSCTVKADPATGAYWAYYTVTVSTKQGTSSSIALADAWSGALGAWSSESQLTVTKSDGQTLEVTTSNASEKQAALAVGTSGYQLTLPQLAAGESYTVTYRLPVSADAGSTTATGANDASATITTTGGTYTAEASASFTKSGWSSKTGTANGDAINWRIVIDTVSSLEGASVSDVVTTADGTVPITGKITVKYPDGSTKQFDSLADVTFGDSTGTYVITYATAAEAGVQQHNTFTVTPTGGEPMFRGESWVTPPSTSGSGDTGSGSGGNENTFDAISKKANAISRTEDASLVEAAWTVTLGEEGGEAIPAGTVFSEALTGDIYTEMLHDGHFYLHFFTADQVVEYLENLEEALKAATGGSVPRYSVRVATWRNNAGADEANNYCAATNPYQGDYYDITAASGTGFDAAKLATVPTWANGQDAVFSIIEVTFLEDPEISVSAFTFSFTTTQYVGDGETAMDIVNRASVNGHTAQDSLEYQPALSKENHNLSSDVFYNGGNWNYDGWYVTEEGNSLFSSRTYPLQWQITVTPPVGYTSGDLTLVEDLPAGVNFGELELEASAYMAAGSTETTTVVGGAVWTDSGYQTSYGVRVEKVVVQQVKLDTDGNEVRDADGNLVMVEHEKLLITIPESLLTAEAGLKEAVFIIRTSVNASDFELTDETYRKVTEAGGSSIKYVYTNTATLLDANGKEIEGSEATQTVSKSITSLLSKSAGNVATSESTATIPYTLQLNTLSKDLVDGNGTLTVTDTATFTYPVANGMVEVRLVPGSVHLYRSDGTEVLNADGTSVAYQELAPTTVKVNSDYVTTCAFTVEVPDSTSLKLVYEYEVTGSASAATSVHVQNSATLEGAWAASSDTWASVSKADGSLGTAGIYAHKVDAEDKSVTLGSFSVSDSAIFKVEYWDKDAGAWVVLHEALTLGPTGEFNLTGQAYNDHTAIEGKTYIKVNTALRVTELQAPTVRDESGAITAQYVPLETAIELVIVDANTEAYPESIPAGYDGTYVQSGGDWYIPNSVDTTSLTVAKQWFQQVGANNVEAYQEADNYKVLIDVLQCADGSDEGRVVATVLLTKDEAYEFSYAGAVDEDGAPLEGDDLDAYFEAHKNEASYWTYAARSGSWSWTTNDLAGSGYDSSTGKTVAYTYRVRERGLGENEHVAYRADAGVGLFDFSHPVTNFSVMTVNNEGIASGTVTVQNIVPEEDLGEFTLPLAGGGGTQSFLQAGIAVLACAVAIGLHRLRHSMAGQG